MKKKPIKKARRFPFRFVHYIGGECMYELLYRYMAEKYGNITMKDFTKWAKKLHIPIPVESEKVTCKKHQLQIETGDYEWDLYIRDMNTDDVVTLTPDMVKPLIDLLKKLL